MTLPNRPFRNIILPAMILTPLLWLMAGCFYLPWFEHSIHKGPNARALVGISDSDRQIRPRHATREQVHAALGRPEYVSADGTADGYVAITSNGYWVWPLCFAAVPGNEKVYVVRLAYDQNGLLDHFTWADADARYAPIEMYHQYPADVAIEKLNRMERPPLVLIPHNGGK